MKARVLRGGWATGALAVLLGSALGGGAGWQRVTDANNVGSAQVPAARPAPPGASPSAATDADRECLARRAELWKLPELVLPRSDAPELRAQLLGRAKGVPVLFLSRPEPDQSDPAADALRLTLERSPGYATFDTVVGKVRQSPELARAVFLSEGYLYTEAPELATLYGSLTLSLLFRDPELLIVRGKVELSARA